MSDVPITPSRTPAIQKKSRIFGQFIIKTRFQLKFSLMIFLFLFCASVLIWLEGHVMVKNMVANGVVTNDDAIASLKLLNGIVARTSVLALAITFGLALFFSHFIAGPIYRFEKTLEQMREGNLNVNVRLRKNDELKDVADLFNQTLASLRNRVRKERDGLTISLDKAMELVESLKKAGRNQESNELEQLIKDIKSIPPQLQI